MGLFSSTKKTYVSSVSYNLAGDIDLRPQYLRALVTRNILSGTKDTISQTLNNGYLHGPGIAMRNFHKWALDNYPTGVPTGKLLDATNVPTTTIAPQIPGVTAPKVALVQDAVAGSADYTYWAERWMLDNHPTLVDSEWQSDYIETTGQIKITFQDLSTALFTPSNPTFSYAEKYLYVSYVTVLEDEVTGSGTTGIVAIPTGDPFPSTTGWTTISNVLTPQSVNLVETTRVVVTYSDSTPGSDDTTYTDADFPYDDRVAEYQKTEYHGSTIVGDDEIITSTRYNMFFWQVGEIVETEDEDVVVEEVSPGVFKTTTTTITTESLQLNRTYRIDHEDLNNIEWSTLKNYIYKKGTGKPVLDALIPENDTTGQFFPFIPVRIDGQFVSETYLPVTYGRVKKAYKKVMKKSIDDLIDSIAENDDIDDIDFATVVFGVSLNTKENASRKYIYKFIENLYTYQTANKFLYDTWKTQYTAYASAMADWLEWKHHQEDEDRPRYGDPAPFVPAKVTLPSNHITIRSPNPFAETFDMRLYWNYIDEVSGSGLGKPGAKRGDYWIEYEGTETYVNYINNGRTGIAPDDYKIHVIRIFWQNTPTTWKAFDIGGFTHHNYVYNGKSVDIDAKEALDDDEESSFILPLHYPTYKAVAVIDGTQMATASSYIIFNSYQIVKQRWYEKGIFKIIFMIAIAIISVVFTGGAGIGLLGAHLTVGASLGFSGMTAAIVGSIANAMAALVLTTIIEKVAGQFGVLGPIIGSLFSFFVGGMIQGFQGGFNFNWGDLLKVENILKLTDVLSSGYKSIVQASIADMAAQSEDIMNSYKKESDNISKLYAENIGYANNIIDPMMLANSSSIYLESGDTFLTRTLMTGSDVAAMSHDMLNNFTELTLTLPTAYA